MKPKVSIICITYNQEKYIQKALDSFLMQKTNFSFEVLIHDDASTDGTQKIIKEYEKKYPKIIKPTYENQNQFSKNNVRFIDKMFRDATGHYIALCEGDDYWTDRLKLQRQVDFLESKPSFSMCFHPVEILYESDNSKKELFPIQKEASFFTLENLIRANFIQTNSVVYRKQDYTNLKSDTLPNDWYLHLYHAKFGKIGFIDKPMAVYLIHPGGVWSHRGDDVKFWQDKWLNHIELYKKFLVMFKENSKYLQIIELSIGNIFYILSEVDRKHGTKIALKAIEHAPTEVIASVSAQKKIIDLQNEDIEHLLKELENAKMSMSNYQYNIAEKEDELNAIKSSRAWKILSKVRNVKNRLINRKYFV